MPVNGIQGRQIYCKQGDPLSPPILILVANESHHIIAWCRRGVIKGLKCQDDTNAVINLQFTDDTLIFETESLSQAMILKWILFCYEMWFGLKINFHKSYIIFLGEILVNSFLLSPGL